MSWPCAMVRSIRRVEHDRGSNLLYALADGREVGFRELPVGSMFHSDQIPPLRDGTKTHSGEPSLCVVLPGKVTWYLHHPGTNGCRWQISGEPPKVTASPSINYVGLYHGWLRDGVVTDDCEGRRFSTDGYPLQ